METKEMKKQAGEMFDNGKDWLTKQLTNFNDLSLLDKIIAITVLHYGVRFFKKKSSED